ncbi:MAG: hydrogenase [Acidobacteria bacterium]|nr:MAG: hydrogenase [Acidobacteriota bacterium]
MSDTIELVPHVDNPTAWVDGVPLYRADLTISQVNRDLTAAIFRKPNKFWLLGMAIAHLCLFVGIYVVWVQLHVGMGVLGLKRPGMWGTYIVDFVFWVGIAHAGTLISAILYLFRQRWRTAINRSAEAMTIFAVMCAGLFPLLHIGRTLIAYWLIPYPNPRHLWVNFRSPLVWDVFAVSTYTIISILFWYQGMIPDLATVRDMHPNQWGRKFYGVIAQRWKGTAKDWHHYESAYGMFAAIATPLVLSVHSVVSSDFAVSSIPGWHDTIFPPYFVAGAIFSGFAMVITVLTVVRKAFNLEDYITMDHMELMAKIIVATSMIVSYGYIVEVFMAWYGQVPQENHIYIWIRFFGPYAWAGWTIVFCNCIAPLIFWFRKARRSLLLLFVVSIIINIGMWFERYVIIITSLSQDFLPSNWRYFAPTWMDIGTFVGSLGLFFINFMMFARVVPVISIAEVKGVLQNQVGEPRAPKPLTGGKNAEVRA